MNILIYFLVEVTSGDLYGLLVTFGVFEWQLLSSCRCFTAQVTCAFMTARPKRAPTGKRSHLCPTWFWSAIQSRTPPTLRSLWTPRPSSAATRWTWSSRTVMRGSFASGSKSYMLKIQGSNLNQLLKPMFSLLALISIAHQHRSIYCSVVTQSHLVLSVSTTEFNLNKLFVSLGSLISWVMIQRTCWIVLCMSTTMLWIQTTLPRPTKTVSINKNVKHNWI